jgi:tryptophan synthase beta subunit
VQFCITAGAAQDSGATDQASERGGKAHGICAKVVGARFGWVNNTGMATDDVGGGDANVEIVFTISAANVNNVAVGKVELSGNVSGNINATVGEERYVGAAC